MEKEAEEYARRAGLSTEQLETRTSILLLFIALPDRSQSRQKTRGKRRESASMVPMDVIEVGNGPGPRRDALHMDEEARLASSDLENCPEVWGPELDDYILETKKRQNQVASYFWTSRLVRLRVTLGCVTSHISCCRIVTRRRRRTWTICTIPRLLLSLCGPLHLMPLSTRHIIDLSTTMNAYIPTDTTFTKTTVHRLETSHNLVSVQKTSRTALNAPFSVTKYRCQHPLPRSQLRNAKARARNVQLKKPIVIPAASLMYHWQRPRRRNRLWRRLHLRLALRLQCLHQPRKGGWKKMQSALRMM